MRCARCRRNIAKAVMVDGKGYGASCAAKVGDLLTQPAQRQTTKRRRAPRGNERQPALFVEGA